MFFNNKTVKEPVITGKSIESSLTGIVAQFNNTITKLQKVVTDAAALTTANQEKIAALQKENEAMAAATERANGIIENISKLIGVN